MKTQNDSPQYGEYYKVSPSRIYHKHFQGYTEIRETKPNGRTRIKRCYTAPWQQHDISGKAWIQVKALYAFLSLLAAAFYLVALTRDLGSNHSWFVALPGLTAGMFLFLLLIVTIQYIVTPRKMTLWEHTSSTSKLKLFSLLALILLFLTAAATGIYALMESDGTALQELLCAGLLLLSSVCAALIHRIESHMAYTTIPNDTLPPEGGYLIE